MILLLLVSSCKVSDYLIFNVIFVLFSYQRRINETKWYAK